MPVKLSKICKDLNVGLSTAVEFLNKKNQTVENNPNVKITDEQYGLLVKEFGGTPPPKKTGMPDFREGKPKEPLQKPLPEQKREGGEIKTEIPKPETKIIGKIDLPDNNNGNPRRSRRDRRRGSDKRTQPQNGQTERPATSDKKPASSNGRKPAHDTNRTASNTSPSAKNDAQDSRKLSRQPERDSKPSPDKPRQAPPEIRTKTDATSAQPPVNKEAAIVKRDEVPFRLKQKPPIEFTVVDKISLDELEKRNQASTLGTRRKTRSEKRREQRLKYQTEQQKTTGQPSDKTQKPPQQNKPFDKSRPPQKTAGTTPQTTEAGKHKRQRIQKERVDVANTPGTNVRRDDRRKPPYRSGGGANAGATKRPVRTEVSVEDVQKQVKETLARLTSKNTKNKGAKYRRDKRDAAADRERVMLAEEERESKVVKLTEFVTANDLASMMNIPVTQVISTCMSIGIMVSINQRLDAETINIVAEEFGFTTEYVSADVVEAINEEADKEEDLLPRPPIITVMGHVDHGKTSLLDNIRKTNVIAGEAGGITQHIGAYNVGLPNGRHITFLDTPGHEAFTAMRARGAKVTDIAIIIVAADDSVMPQTVEAINHASAAGVPIVFAINKIDKPHANSEKIKEQLANMNYLVEDWGGKYQCQEISAKQGIGVPELLEKVLLEADLLELKANPQRRAIGSVIESSLDKGRGFVSTILVSNGTLKQGDIVLAGTHYGRIKAMFNERNIRISQAGPSEPALILGLDGAPQAGDAFHVLETDQEAREIAARREQLQRELGLRTQKRFGLEELGRRRALGDFHELNLIVKGDVDGSVEAISDSLIKLSTEEIQVNVIHKAVGQISESDASLAATANAVIIGFQVRPSVQARRLAENEGVEIRLYSIIYDAINDVKDAMEGMLSPEIHEEQNGELEVLQVFKVSKVGTVAGCMVKEGKIKRSNKVRVIRDGIVIYTGDLGSLKRFKDEVKEVYTGQDCGIFINNLNDIQIGDIIEAFDQFEVKKTL